MTINDSNQSILKLRPVLVERIWGGTWLKHEFGYQTTSPSIGEAWVISAHKSGDCQIENGLYKGQTLSEVYREHRELFANDQAEKFPLLVKFIDAKEDLSVQVHPGDAYAQAHEHQSGKSEAWIILGALPNSRILIGHNAKNRDELTSMINQQKWNQLLTYRDVAKDEVINIPSGTVHAICAGTTLIEIQQSSDVTYRLYDYDRLDNEGQKRDLHLNKAIDVIDVPHVVVPRKFLPNNPPPNALISVLKTKQFEILSLIVKGEYSIAGQEDKYRLLAIIDGNGQVGDLPVKKGDSLILTSRLGQIKITGNLRVIIATK